MVIVVIAGSLIGMCLPFLLSRLKLDPATASAPVVTSMADACGVLVYFGIATAVLGLPV
ncbi:magnesium transporter [Stutzerimonas tarimensis]|uniref:Magnesium transporter n=1 Tax=Stutzerimonas tarimensis TaxID=1507735 RepID=A0ABV7T1Z1_9GAMM